MASFSQMLDDKMIARDLMPRTRDCYRFWVRKAYDFIQRPASEWSGEDVVRFLIDMGREAYSRVSRKQALCALKFAFDHVLRADLGTLNLPLKSPTNN